MKKSKEIIKIIFDQLRSSEVDRILIGIKCLEALNSKYREFLHSSAMKVFQILSELVRSDNEKVKKAAMDFLVSILSSWVGKERESLGDL
mmetsp:Transcript_17019/g.16707  ORF Transcript_17019/g.16707 Transcript_17019/m.16707 type:complete len:90 (+) Transcript_17019:1143-1412(+)